MQTSLWLNFKSLANSCLHFLYPETCAGCGKELHTNERVLCWRCAEQLPFTRFENEIRNPVFMELAGRIKVEFATAILVFKKQGIVQNMLHGLKYHGRSETGLFLGRITGERLKASSAFNVPDFMIPVPLHPQKEKKRGYNQSLRIAEGISEYFPKMTIEKTLLKKRNVSESQTRKNRAARWENAKESFCLSDTALQETRFAGRHFLIVDDVFTTGATVESCARQILRIPGARVSVITIAAPI